MQFFLRTISGISYTHLPELAPSAEMLSSYRKGTQSWDEYEKGYLALISERRIEDSVPRHLFDMGCLLCSEDKPHRCHRRLAAEYLREKWGDLEITHL